MTVEDRVAGNQYTMAGKWNPKEDAAELNKFLTAVSKVGPHTRARVCMSARAHAWA